MKHITGIVALLLSLSLLAACTSQGQSYDPPAEEPDVSPVSGTEGEITCADPPVSALFRIVDGAEQGNLLLAALEGSAAGVGNVFRLGTADLEIYQDRQKMDPSALKDGMTVEINWRGDILETYPAQWSNVILVEIKDGTDDLCGLYLQVLEDLWSVDPGLNTGITELGVDLSGLTDLSESEKAAVAWRFGELHGLSPIQGTFEELCEQGYIDRENLYWEDGCLFSLTGSAEGGFDAEKWRSGLGAYFFCDCSARMAKDGIWSYTVGSEAIS